MKSTLPPTKLPTTDVKRVDNMKITTTPPPTNPTDSANTNKLNEAVTGLLLLNANEHSEIIEDALEENANLMPVGKSPKPDLVREMDNNQTHKQTDHKDIDSSDGT